jgi:hypothetical protein
MKEPSSDEISSFASKVLAGERVSFFVGERFVFAEIRGSISNRELFVVAANVNSQSHMTAEVPLRGGVEYRHQTVELYLKTAGTSEHHG